MIHYENEMEKEYEFDRVFDQVESMTEIFEQAILPCVTDAVSKYQTSSFMTYGEAGLGKT